MPPHSLAAKEEAFQESIKLKNQFRNLDQNEADFLDSVLESTREKEAALKKETAEQLDAFRRQREEADRKLALEEDGGGDDDDHDPKGAGKQVLESNDGSLEGVTQWAVGTKKRKRTGEKEGMIKGVKLRRASSPTASKAQISPGREAQPIAQATEEQHTQGKKDTSDTRNASSGGGHDTPLPPSLPKQPMNQPESETEPESRIASQSTNFASPSPGHLTSNDNAKPRSPQSPQKVSALGLAGYSSDDDD